uniref:Putative secreted protein n=1 Tax=Anopheles marajoara TaxID=58244 RepID=A0A2M4CEA4_9DIPT
MVTDGFLVMMILAAALHCRCHRRRHRSIGSDRESSRFATQLLQRILFLPLVAEITLKRRILTRCCGVTLRL